MWIPGGGLAPLLFKTDMQQNIVNAPSGALVVADEKGTQRIYAFAQMESALRQHRVSVVLEIPKTIAMASSKRSFMRNLALLAISAVMAILSIWWIDDLAARTEAADGFAQVFPEHKYNIVNALQKKGHIVGMTGGGVNDALALKQADVGIAVSGATDAARSVADLVLTAPGLSVLVRAVEEARRILERMHSYAVYRITETIRFMISAVLAMIVFNFYPITAIMIILLAFLNDIPIMTIAYDHTGLDPNPVRWDMQRIIAVSSVMGLTGVIGSFLMLYIALDLLHLSIPQVQTYIFLKMAVSGHLTLFVARSKGFFLKKPYPAPVMIWSDLATKLAGTLLSAYGFGLIIPIG